MDVGGRVRAGTTAAAAGVLVLCNVRYAKTFTKDELAGLQCGTGVQAGARLKQFRAKAGAEAMERQYQCQKKVVAV